MGIKYIVAFGLFAVAGIGMLGCSKPEVATTEETPKSSTAESGHSHDGWWCGEHGVPEEVCTRCNAKLIADFKAKGDWCKDHDLPDSQCFVCHPEKEAEFAAQYEAKYGTKPPKADAGEAHDHEHEAKS
jgi:hypothetical protein